MQLCEVFLNFNEDDFAALVRGISLGKLRTYQMYDAFKARAHLSKLNTDTLRRATPRLRERLAGGDEELAKDLAQAILLSHLDMIPAVLDFLGIPHENGFFAKGLDPSPYLQPGWQQRVFDEFKGKFPTNILLLYINHLAWELDKPAACFRPQA